MTKQITGTASKPLAMKAGEQQVITIAKGQQLRIQELINGQMKDAGKVMSSRKGKDLQVKFLDGTELVVKDFFEVCQGDACSVTLGDSQLGSFTITADTPLGNQLPDGTHLVHYSLSDASSLMDLAAAGGDFIKTSTATVAQAAAPAVLETASVAQAATLTGGSNLLWAGLGLAVAAGAGGGGGGSAPVINPPPLPDGFKGVVWDTPVSNAIVFRDLNGDGIWDANEPITITDKFGKYEGLSGEGDIVATSLDRLLWRGTATYVEYVSVVTNNVSVAVPTTKTIDFVFEGAAFDLANSSAEKIRELIDPENQYLNGGQTRYNSAEKLQELDDIIAKMGVDILPYITGFSLAPLTVAGKVFDENSDLVAIDIGTNLENESTGNLPSGDDFVWSGTYVIGAPMQDGEVSVHVTAVSTLVKAYMEMNGGTAAQALAAIKAGLDFDQSSGTGAAGSSTRILTGELNAQITRLMGEVIARAEAEDFSSDGQRSMIDEITATLETLAAAIKSAVVAETKIDLTNPDHLFDIFNGAELGLILNDDYEAQALALQIGATGPATHSVWHTETVDGDIFSNVEDSADATLATDEVVGNITVLARDDFSGVSLNVEGMTVGEDTDSAFLQSSRIRVQASGEDAFAGLGIESAQGAISDLDILATGDGSLAGVMVSEDASGHLSVTGDVLVRADGDIDRGEDYSIAMGYVVGSNVELGTTTRGTNLTVAADGEDAEAQLLMSRVSGHVDDIMVQAGGESADADINVEVTQDQTLTVDNITVTASGESAEADAYLRGGSEVDGSPWSVPGVVAGDLVVEGNTLVSASGVRSVAELDINSDLSEDFGATVFDGGKLTVESAGTNAVAGAHIRQASGELTDVTVEATGLSQVDGFDFLNYFTPSLRDDLEISVDVAGDDYYFDITSVEQQMVGNLPQTLQTIVDHLNGQLVDKNFHFATSHAASPDFKQGLFVVWDNIKNNDLPVLFKVNGSTVVNNNFLYEQHGTDNSQAALQLVTDQLDSDENRLTIGNVHVHAESYEGNASADIKGFVNITGTMSVLASEVDATATAEINSNLVDPTVLGLGSQGVTLTVSASAHEAEARLDIRNASGAVGAVEVTSTEREADAELNLEVQSGQKLTIASVNVESGPDNVSEDSRWIDATMEVDGAVDITGNISVSASGRDGEAHLEINEENSLDAVVLGNGLVGSAMTVTASGEDAEAHLHIHNASGAVGAIEVTSTEREADAVLDLEVQSGKKLTIASVNVESGPDEVNEDSRWIDAKMYVDGAVDIKGNISVSASGRDGEALFEINENNSLDAVVLGNGGVGGDLTVTASGEDADAHLHIHNVSGSVGAIEVTSTEREADADLNLEVQSGKKLTIASVNVESGPDEVNEDTRWIDAKMYVEGSGEVDIKGNISVSASGEDGEALLEINENNSLDAVVLGNGGVGSDLTVTASGYDSDAHLHIHSASGTLGDILLTASGQSADAELDLHTEGVGINADNLTLLASNSDANAYADIEGDVQISGDIQVTASETRAKAHADINDETSGATTLGDSDISVTASGLLAESILDIANASGSVGAMDVTASGQSSDAHLDLEVAQDATLTLDSISVTGTDATNADASIYLRGASVADNKPWTQPGLESGTIEIHGDISVSAKSLQSDVDLDINSDFSQDFGPTEFNDAGNLNVKASATDATAEARILNASGNLGNVTVTATGKPEVVGFDFSNFIADSFQGKLARGDILSMDVDCDDYLFSFDTVQQQDLDNLEVVLGLIASAFNTKAEKEGADYRFEINYNGPQSFATGLFVVWNGIQNKTPDYDISFNGQSIKTSVDDNDRPYLYTQDATERSTADLHLVTDVNRLTMNAVTVVADAQSSDAHADLSGVLSISGDISVTAGELLSTASADINAEFEDLTTLGDEGQAIDLTVTASGVCSDADLHIGNASGFVNDITISADADNAHADMTLQLNGDIEGDISVSADGSAADAFADISGEVALTSAMVTVTAFSTDAEADLDINSANGLINDIDVSATGTNASADLSLQFNGTVDGNIEVSADGSSTEAYATILGDVEMEGGDLTVTANGQSADADLIMDSVSGAVGSINVTASGLSSDAELHLDIDSTDTLTATSLAVLASEVNADASANITGPVTAISGNITVTANDVNAHAYASIDNTGEDRNALGSNGVGSELTVTASSTDADAELHMTHVSGLVSDIEVTAMGTDANADLTIQFVGDVSGDVTVDANGVSADAEAIISGQTTFGHKEGEATEGSNLIVSAANSSADADLSIYTADGVIDTISVDAHGFDASADLNLGFDGVIDGNIDVHASGQTAQANAHIDGDIHIHGDVSVIASNSTDTAHADINASGLSMFSVDPAPVNSVFGREVAGNTIGSNLTVTASGYESSADLNIGSASGVINAIAVTSDGESADAIFGLVTTDEGVTVSSVTVSANEYASIAGAQILGEVTVNGNISIDANGEDALAAAGMMGDVTITGDISVHAHGEDSSADAYIVGTVEITGDIEVVASGEYASADAMFAGEVDISGDIDVVASGEYASANAMFAGEVDITGNLDVSAISDDANATVSMSGDIDITGNIDIAATSQDAEAEVWMAGSVDIDGSIAISASGEDSQASAVMFGDVSITGNISVDSSGEDSVAYGVLNMLSGDANLVGTTTLGQEIDEVSVGSNITVSATGKDTIFGQSQDYEAGFVSQNTRGHVGELDVSSTGESTDAIGIMGVKDAETLKFDSISVNATSSGTDNVTATVYLYGQDGQATDQKNWNEQTDFSTDHGTVEITGNITVTANGINDDVILHVNSGESLDLDIDFNSTNRGYTVLGGGDITIEATATDASADVVIHNAEGSVGDIALTAGGVPEVLAFDFLYQFDHISGDEIANEDFITFTVNDDVTLTHEFNFVDRTIPATPTAEFINGLLAEVIASLNAQAKEKGLNVHFADAFEGSSAFANQTGLFAIWDTVRPQDKGAFGFNGDPLVASKIDDPNAFGSINSTARFELETEKDGVTIRSIAVTASAESAESELDIEGAGVAINGDISVVASEVFAFAEADINDGSEEDIDGPTVLGLGDVGSNITVTASAVSSEADLDIEKAQGLVGDIAVTSGADFTETDLEFWSNAKGLEAASLTVIADGFSAETDVEIDADADFTITGDVYVKANDTSADADVNMYGKTSVAHYHVQGDITVEAFSEDALAHLVIIDESRDVGEDDYRGEGQVTLGTESIGTNITLETDGQDAEAHLHIFSAQGNVNAIDLQSSGSDDWTHLELEAGADRNITIESLTVTSNISGDSSKAEVEMWTANDDASLAIKGDVVVKAEGHTTEALVDINNKDTELKNFDNTFSTGVVSFGNTIEGQTVGSSITVTASGEESIADADIRNALGAVDAVEVSATNTDADAYLNVEVEAQETLTINTIRVVSNSEGEDSAHAAGNLYGQSGSDNLDGTVQIDSDITVVANGLNDAATLNVNTVVTSMDVTKALYLTVLTQDQWSGNNPGFLLSIGSEVIVLNDIFDDIYDELVTPPSSLQGLIAFFKDNADEIHGILNRQANDDFEFALNFDRADSGELNLDIIWSSGVKPVEPIISIEMAESINIDGAYVSGYIDELVSAVKTQVAPQEVLAAFGLLGGVEAVEAVLDRDLFATKGGDGHTVLAGGDITVSASDSDASAILRVNNAVGTVGDINLSATGVLQAQGFDFLAYFDHEEGDEIDNGDTFSYTINGVTLSHEFTFANQTIPESPSPEFVRGLLDDVIESFNTQSKEQGLGITFMSSIDVQGDPETALFAVWNNIRPEKTGDFSFGNETASDESVYTFELRDGSIDSYARFYLETEQSGVTIASVDVTAEAERAVAELFIEGAGVQITGDISVVASEVDALAVVDINDSTGGPTPDGDSVLGNGNVGSNLTVTASAYNAESALDIENANGLVAHIDVTASSDDAIAELELWSNSKGLVAGSLTAVAQGEDAEADVELDADGDLTIKGEVQITAKGEDADANVEIHAKEADGHLFLQGDISVSALTDDAYAKLEVVDEFDEIDVTDVNGEDLSVGVREQGQVTLGTSSAAIDLNVITNGEDAEAHIHIFSAGGDVADIKVESSGEDAYAHIEMEAGANRELSIENLSVRSITGVFNEAEVELWTAADTANISMKGNVLVSAEDLLTEATLTVNDKAYDSYDLNDEFDNYVVSADAIDDNFNTGTITFGDGEVGSDITISASGEDAYAEADIRNALGLMDSVDVSATSTDADAYLNVEAAANATLSVNTIHVEANSEGEDSANAEANFYGRLADNEQNPMARTISDHGTVQINGDVTVLASGLNDDASLTVNVGEENSTTVIDLKKLSYLTSDFGLANHWASFNSAPTDSEFKWVFGDFGPEVIFENFLSGSNTLYTNLIYPSEFDLDSLNLQVAGKGFSFVVTDVNGIVLDGTNDSLIAQLSIVWEPGIRPVEPTLWVKYPSPLDKWTELNDELIAEIMTPGSGNIDFPGSFRPGTFVPAFDPTVLEKAMTTTTTVYEETGHTVFGGGNFTVEASATSADAEANVDNASGEIDALKVMATGLSSNAITEIAVETAKTLTIDTIDVTANTFGSDDWALADAYIYGNPGTLAQDPEFEELEDPVLPGTVRITGDIQVQALGENDEAILNINFNEEAWSLDAGNTVLAGGDITVLGHATEAWADLHMGNVSGQAGNLTVTASGTQEVHGFDFARYFARTLPNNLPNTVRRFTLAGGDVFEYTLGDQTLSYTVTAEDAVSNLNVNLLLGKVVTQFNNDAAKLGLGVEFRTSHESAADELAFGLFTVWKSVRDESVMPVLSVTRSDIRPDIAEIDSQEFFWGQDGTDNSYAHLSISMQEGESLDVQNITVTNSAENEFSEGEDPSDGIEYANVYDDDAAYANLFGDTRVNGDITVTASELNSYAELTINHSGEHNHNGAHNHYGDYVEPAAELIGDTTFVSTDITVTASGQIAYANVLVDNGLGTVHDITVTASGDHKMFDAGVNPDLSCDTGSYDVLCSLDLVHSIANLDLHLNGAITGAVNVVASNFDAEASATITGLKADLKNVKLKADEQDALAQASISFDDGVALNVSLNAEHHRSTTLIDLDQADSYRIPEPRTNTSVPANTGTVTVEGEGHVGITYYVDAYSSTAKTIDITAMNEPLNDVSFDAKGEKDWVGDWGFVDLDLVAKDFNGRSQSQQTNYMTDLLPKMIHIDGFNVQRDSINLRRENVDALDHDSLDVVFSCDTVTTVAWGVVVEEDLEFSSAYQQELMTLLNDAVDFFDNRSTDADEYTIGYFYREITFHLGSDEFGTPSVTRSFMVYDHDLDSAGASGIISFGETTGLSERNVAHRYSIVETFGEDETSTDTLDGFHAIELLSFTSSSGDVEMSYDLSDEADVMLGDIVVRAFSESCDTDANMSLSLSASADASDPGPLDPSPIDPNPVDPGPSSGPTPAPAPEPTSIKRTNEVCDDVTVTSLQLRQSNILVAADGLGSSTGNSANLNIEGAWGTIASLTLEAINGAEVDVYIGGNDNFESGDDYFDHGIFVQDVRVMAGGEDSSASLDLTVNGFVEKLELEVLGASSDVSVILDQDKYGGQVFVSGSNLNDIDDADYCVDEIGSNDVSLVFENATASKITIDNTGREAGSHEDINFSLILAGDDLDLYTAISVWSTRLTIEGWTENDTFMYESADVATKINFQVYDGQDLVESSANFNKLFGNALSALNRGDRDIDYYFGKMGDNGYLFYDDDNKGVTGVVEFVDFSTFEYDWIKGSLTPTE